MPKHSPEQIITKLRAAEVDQAGGMTIGQVCQKLEVSEPTFNRWRNQYGGMKSSGRTVTMSKLVRRRNPSMSSRE